MAKKKSSAQPNTGSAESADTGRQVAAADADTSPPVDPPVGEETGVEDTAGDEPSAAKRTTTTRTRSSTTTTRSESQDTTTTVHDLPEVFAAPAGDHPRPVG